MSEEMKATDRQIAGDVAPVEGSATAGDLEKSLSTEEVEKLLQSERDKIAQKVRSEKDKELSKLQKQIDEMKRAQMSEDERVKAELDEARKEKEQIELEARQFRRQLAIEKAARKYSLPDNFAKRLQGETDDEIDADAQSIAEYLGKEVQDRATGEINKKLSGKPPEGGKTPESNSFQSRYDTAKARKDAALMLRIQRDAAAAGEVIKQF